MSTLDSQNGTVDGGAANEDSLIVARVLAGETKAFEEIVRRHERRVYRTTLAITKNQEDAEDALQETFIKAYKNLATFRQESRFTTWLTRIAINEGLLKLRSRRPAVSIEEQEEERGGLVLPTRVEDWYSNPEVRFAQAQLKRIVEDAIHSLDEPYRAVFVLRDIEECSTKETAEALGIGVAAMKSRLLRARLKVREELSKRLARPVTLKSQMMHLMLVVKDVLGSRFERQAAGSREVRR